MGESRELIFKQIVDFLNVLRPITHKNRRGILILTDEHGIVLHTFSGNTERFDQMPENSGFCLGENIREALPLDNKFLQEGIKFFEHKLQMLVIENQNHYSTCLYAPIWHKREHSGYLIYLLADGSPVAPYRGIVAACVNYFEVELNNRDIITDLNRTNKLLSDILRFIPDACIIFDRNENIILINEKAMSLLETDPYLSARFVLGHSYREFFDAKDVTSSDWMRAPMVNCQIDLITTSGRRRKMYNTSSIIATEDGTPEAVINCLKETSDVHKLVNNVAGNQARYTFDDIIRKSPAMEQVITYCKKIADVAHPMLIESESGTGKELFAQSIHNASRRRNQPFVVVDCSSIPRELLESELFGYASGSFTGASKSGKLGKIALANGGTVFFDEIGELPLSLQAKFLRFVQFKTFMSVGGTTTQQADVRIIAATNRSLRDEIEKQNYRQDLYFRLNIFNVTIPPLRNRPEDIPVLSEHFIDKYKAEFNNMGAYLSADALDVMCCYPWPGNVRELENTIIRALAISDGTIMPQHLQIWETQIQSPSGEPQKHLPSPSTTIYNSTVY